MPAGQFRYRAFGLNFACEFPLDWMPQCPLEPAGAQIRVVRGAVPSTLAGVTTRGVGFAGNAKEGIIELTDIAGIRCLVRDGHSIVVEAPRTSSDDNARFRLDPLAFAACLGPLFLQRSTLALRGSQVDLQQRATIFIGPSGSGKSTIASALIGRGGRLRADAISVVAFDRGDTPHAWPGPPTAELWPDAAESLGLSPSALARVRAGIEKRFWTCPRPSTRAASPIAAIYALSHGSDGRGARQLDIERVSGTRAFSLLHDNVFGSSHGLGTGHEARVCVQLGQLAQRVPVFEVRGLGPRGEFTHHEELADRLASDSHGGAP